MHQLSNNIVINTMFLCFILSCCESRNYGEKYCSDCNLIEKCPDAIQLLKTAPYENEKRLKEVHCGFDGMLPKVCCSELAVQDDVESHRNLNLLPDNCSPRNDGERIIGGTKAGLYEFPWMVLISYRTHGDFQFKCGGTLITNRYVLTAAHCITEGTIAGVRIGDHNINTDTDCEGEAPPNIVCETKYQDILVEKEIPHELYRGNSFNTHDIGLLRLKKPVDFSAKNAGTICLPVTSEQRNRNIEKQFATIAGWGSTKTGDTTSSVLLKATIETYTRQACLDVKYRNTVFNEHKEERVENKICAHGTNTDSCNGDSGGPLMIKGKHRGIDRYIQYGIIAYGPNECGSEQPGLYTEVSHYMNWILDNISK